MLPASINGSAAPPCCASQQDRAHSGKVRSMPPEPPKMLRSVKVLRTLRLRLAMQMPCRAGLVGAEEAAGWDCLVRMQQQLQALFSEMAAAA